MNVDLKLLERAVLNVIRNAIEHSKKKAIAGTKIGNRQLLLLYRNKR